MTGSGLQTHPLARRRRRAAQLFALYIAVLALIVFWPSPVDPGASTGMLSDVLRSLHRRGMPGWINYTLVESVANVLLFVPFGLLAASWLTDRWIWLAAVVGIAASCIIESVQAVLLPNRVASIYDVNANSLGAALGCVAVYAWRSRRRT